MNIYLYIYVLKWCFNNNKLMKYNFLNITFNMKINTIVIENVNHIRFLVTCIDNCIIFIYPKNYIQNFKIN